MAKKKPDEPVIIVDMCPQANLSEIVLGGNIEGAKNLEEICGKGSARKTIGGYFDARISSPHKLTGDEESYLIKAKDYNAALTDNVWLLAGDPSLEIQTQAMNQISAQTLPANAWRNVHFWLKDLTDSCVAHLSATRVFIDCNPSFAAYTELAMAAADRLIVPCSCDGSSARAIDNLGALLFGVNASADHHHISFHQKATSAGMKIPLIHAVVMNRSTQYDKKASKAFAAMFDEIKRRISTLNSGNPEAFSQPTCLFKEVPDAHSIAIICAHSGRPLNSITSGKYEVYGTNPQVNEEPLNRYQSAVADLITAL